MICVCGWMLVCICVFGGFACCLGVQLCWLFGVGLVAWWDVVAIVLPV